MYFSVYATPIQLAIIIICPVSMILSFLLLASVIYTAVSVVKAGIYWCISVFMQPNTVGDHNNLSSVNDSVFSSAGLCDLCSCFRC